MIDDHSTHGRGGENTGEGERERTDFCQESNSGIATGKSNTKHYNNIPLPDKKVFPIHLYILMH